MCSDLAMAHKSLDEVQAPLGLSCIHPAHPGLAVKPRQLASGKLSGGFLYSAHGRIHVHLAVQHIKQRRDSLRFSAR